MKKILITLLTIVFTLGLTSCGGPSPSDVTTSFLDALKAQDEETVKSTYSDDSYDFITDTIDVEEDSDEATEQDKEFLKKLEKKMLDFDYEIVKEEIKDDKATVEVKFTTYDMGKVLRNTMSDYMNKAIDLAAKNGFDEVSDEKLYELMYDVFGSNLDKATDKSLDNTAKLTLTKTDSGWKIDEIDDDSEFTNAITGGMIKASKDIDKQYNFY